MTPDELKTIANKLQAYFAPEEVKWKPQGKAYGDKILCVAYIDARCVIERLNEVCGINGWSDRYETLQHGEVRCSLSIKFGTDWITHCDVGSESAQPDQGDRAKAAHSDALKRAAVKFGVGLYLYRMKATYAPYDGKKVTQWPTLPTWAVPPECLPCGKVLGDKIAGLVAAAAKASGQAQAEIDDRIKKNADITGKLEYHRIELRYARETIQQLGDWINKLAAQSNTK